MKLIYVGIGLFTFSVPMVSSAQTFSDATFSGDTFREAYNQNVNVSGQSVVGLALGTNSGLGSIKETFINQSALGSKKNNFCLRIDSQDGLFWSENPYLVSEVSDSNIVRLRPLTENFQLKLNRRKAEEILGFVKLSRDTEFKGCDVASIEDIFIPLQARPDIDAKVLSLRVNSFDRITQVSLGGFESNQVNGNCESIGNAAILYDKVCELVLPEIYPPGIYNLTVTFKVPPFETETTNLSVGLPGRAQ